ncbi:hypothetical protein M011DRAFT_466675 [Sporormia fimetaria CBS 119925]|uniref:UBC core domain-containing protein n=1 Tax=Sporormia fimetaria CBS 119925 TaxID=1340428 RepID=A0A6A6VGE5_9PLEO|nr:hypothetical protein M011DRAFT_466675 [Sporormia fimetaria CBS 119925]
MDSTQFCCEDTVGLKGDRYMIGLVERTFGDVDSHEPEPQREYDEPIECHPDISDDTFARFLRTGVPPRGTALVDWQNQGSFSGPQLIPEARLDLLDRALYVGDVVKRSAKDPMSGTVIGTSATCALFPAPAFGNGRIDPDVLEEVAIRDVPATELWNVHTCAEGQFVVYGDWVGRVEDVLDEVSVRLNNNSVVVVEDPDELKPEDPFVERLSVGDAVTTKKWNLRRGRWKYGAFDPNVRPEGIVVETRTISIHVHWLARRPGATDDASFEEPDSNLELEDLESPRFRIYDATCAAAETLPLLENGVDRSYHVVDLSVNDRVRFKDISAAASKYDGSRALSNGQRQGKLARIPRTDTLGFDMNVFIVMQTKSLVTVQWQDCSVTEQLSTSLIPDPNVSDEDEVWPGEIIVTNEENPDAAAQIQGHFMPKRVGVVQTVNAAERIATVRWFENPYVSFAGDLLLPFSRTGELRPETEDISLYDIRSIPSLTHRRGDFVMMKTDTADSDEVDWFGEVIDLGLDGKLTVRLGAGRAVRDVRVSAESVQLVYSTDMDDAMDYMPPLDGDSVDWTTEEDQSERGPHPFDFWLEYQDENGQPLEGYPEDGWETEESSDDEPMPDLEDFEQPPIAEPGLAPPEADDSYALDGDTTPPHVDQPQIDQRNPESQPLMPFQVLEDDPPRNHHYIQDSPGGKLNLKKIAQEHKILASSLPDGILVRTWESRLDLVRVLMIGPSDTPYEYAPFIIDIKLNRTYPEQPPLAFFHSWTHGLGPVNPNLYEDGKICLSLLGTWHADESGEGWNEKTSSLLQVLISIHSLVLVKEPYYNEAGYDVHRQAPETKLSSALYTERAYFRSRGFITHALENLQDYKEFKEELLYLYLSTDNGAPRLLDRAIEGGKEVVKRSKDEGGERDGLRRISRGAIVMLERQVEKLEGARGMARG